MEASLSTEKIHEEDRIRAKSIVVEAREEGRLVPVVGADNEIELQYELGKEIHRIIPEFSGKLVLRNNLIVLEGRTLPHDPEWTNLSLDRPLTNLRGCLVQPFPGL